MAGGNHVKLALRRLFAFLLSWACPGLGQYFAGRFVRACVALAATCVVFMPLAVELPLYLAWNRWTILGSMGVAIALLFVVPVDAALCVQASPVVHPAPLKRWLIGIAFAVAAFTLTWFTPEWLRTHVPRRLSRVSSAGMVPTLREGDSVTSERRAAGSKPPSAGDIVLFASPENPGDELVKRVVGLPGSTVEVRDGRLILDGFDRTTLPDDGEVATSHTETLGGRTYSVHVKQLDVGTCVDWGPARVPDGSYFMLGDNRCRSRDSRDWGAIPADRLRGRVLRIQWSKDAATGKVRWSRLGTDLTIH